MRLQGDRKGRPCSLRSGLPGGRRRRRWSLRGRVLAPNHGQNCGPLPFRRWSRCCWQSPRGAGQHQSCSCVRPSNCLVGQSPMIRVPFASLACIAIAGVKRLPEGSPSSSCGYAHGRASASGRLRLLALAGKAVDDAVLARHSANGVEVVAKEGRIARTKLP